MALAQKLHQSQLLTFRGVYSHSGDGYNAKSEEDAKNVANIECARAAAFAQKLKDAHVPCPVVSVGSTPSCAAVDQFVGATEIHPGNCQSPLLPLPLAGVCGFPHASARAC